ncbi:MAG: tetratricopeptide repeat protein [Betaproteobacteria bacterium]
MRLFGAIVLTFLLAPAIAQDARISTKRAVTEPPTVPETCQAVRARAEELRIKLDAGVSSAARTAAGTYLAKPTPGSDQPKAWMDFSAHALLYGDAQVSSWAALNAVRTRMGGDTLTGAGIMLSYLGSTEDALAFLNCAYALGHRRPNLLEALAVIHHEQGRRGEAHRYIGAAREADSQDPLIEIAHSLITTGKPPPRPAPTRGLERCIAELEDHSRTVLGRIKERADRFKAITGNDLMPFFQPMATFHQQTLAYSRGLITQARSMPTASQAAFANNAIMQCVFTYFHFTGNLLESYFGTVYSDYTAVVFWADALGIDPAPYWREQRGSGRQGPVVNVFALSIPSEPYITKLWAGVGSSARDCPQMRSAYQREAAHSRQRFQRAGMRFDEIALPLMNIAEYEILAAREFAVRMAGEMKGGGPAAIPGKGIPGAGGKPMTVAEMSVQAINGSYRTTLLDTWLDRQVPEFFNNLGTAFQRDRQNNEQNLQQKKQQIDVVCPAIPPELLEALLAEQWQAYRDGLWEALLSNFEAQWDARLNCNVSINGFSGQLYDDGNWEVGYKGKGFSCKVGPGGAGSIGAGPFTTTIKDGEFTSVSVEGSNWEVTGDSAGVSEATVTVRSVDANYPPFTGAGKLTVGGVRDPRTGRMEPKVGFSGKLGLGFKTKVGGAACYPGSGSVSVTPRKAMGDAIKYALSAR